MIDPVGIGAARPDLDAIRVLSLFRKEKHHLFAVSVSYPIDQECLSESGKEL